MSEVFCRDETRKDQFGIFRLVDRILDYRDKDSIVTSCDLASRTELVRQHGVAPLLMEVAAQSSALMNRMEDKGRNDSFLAKIKQFNFLNALEGSSLVQARVKRIEKGNEITRYQGSVESCGVQLAEFDLLICTTEAIGGGSKERAEYWEHYLNCLIAGLSGQNGETEQ
jgi:hypothetical protein